MKVAPCNCAELADDYKLARKAQNIAIGSHGIDDPKLKERVDSAWKRYEQARANCPFRMAHPHY